MTYNAEYQLKPDGISKSLLFIEESLKEYRMKQRDLLEALLISEETMLLLSDHAPEDAHIKVVHGTWIVISIAARKNERCRLYLFNVARKDIKGHNLGVNVSLSHHACNRLRRVGSEVEHQNEWVA